MAADIDALVAHEDPSLIFDIIHIVAHLSILHEAWLRAAPTAVPSMTRRDGSPQRMEPQHLIGGHRTRCADGLTTTNVGDNPQMPST